MHFLGGSISKAITVLWICVFLKFMIIDNTTAIPYNKKHGGSRHIRVKRTLPFERFRPELRGPGFRMMPGPPFRPEGFPGTSPFEFEPGPPVRFPPSGFRRGGPFARPEVFGRRAPGIFGRPAPSAGGQFALQPSTPIIVETPDGSRNIFLRPGPAGQVIRDLLNRPGNTAISSNPLPRCVPPLTLRCRPWRAGMGPSTPHRCYGNCPGRTCFVNCRCTCESTGGPRILFARFIGRNLPNRGGPGGGVISGSTGPIPPVPGDIGGNPDVGGIDVSLSGPPDPTLDSVMGIPVPLADGQASLPQLGVSDINTGQLSLPDVSVSDINPGQVNLPEIGVPDINSGQISIPDIGVPDINSGQLNFPDISGSGIDSGQVSLPGIGIPDINTGQPSLPDIGIPDFNIGQASSQQVGIPDISLGQGSLPGAGVPDINPSPGSLSLPDINLGAVPEPEISFVSAFDTPSFGGLAGPDSGNLRPTALESPSGITEVDIKLNNPAVGINAGPAFDVRLPDLNSPDINSVGLGDFRTPDINIGTPTISDLEIRQLMDPAITGVLPTLDGIQDVANDIAGAEINVAAGALPLRIQATDQLSQSTFNNANNVAVNKNLPAKLEVAVKQEDENGKIGRGTGNVQAVATGFPGDSLSNPFTSNPSNPDIVKEVNALNSLLMAMGGTPTSGISPETAVLSQLAGAPTAGLDVLLKNMDGAGFPGSGSIDTALVPNVNSSFDGTFGDIGVGLNSNINTSANSIPLDIILSAIASGDKKLLGKTFENTNLAMVAAALGMSGGKSSPFLDLFGGATLDTLGLGGQVLKGESSAPNVTTGVLSSVGNQSIIGSPQLIFPDSTGQSGQSLSRLAPFGIDKAQLAQPGKAITQDASSTNSVQNFNAPNVQFTKTFASLPNGTSNVWKPANSTKNNSVTGIDTPTASVFNGATAKECYAQGSEIWCDPVGVWDNTPGVTKWCLLNCRDKNNCDRSICACSCIDEKTFRIKFEKLPIKSP